MFPMFDVPDVCEVRFSWPCRLNKSLLSAFDERGSFYEDWRAGCDKNEGAVTVFLSSNLLTLSDFCVCAKRTQRASTLPALSFSLSALLRRGLESVTSSWCQVTVLPSSGWTRLTQMLQYCIRRRADRMTSVLDSNDEGDDNCDPPLKTAVSFLLHKLKIHTILQQTKVV